MLCMTLRKRTSGRASRGERLEARIAPDLKRRLAYAASIRGTSLTDFIITSATREATQAIEAHENLRLTERDQQVFVDALLNPPPPRPQLRAAADRYRKRMNNR